MFLVSAAKRRLGVVGEVLAFFVSYKHVWLLPMICIVLLTTVILVVVESAAVVPFIYSLF
ncbi:MAG TPA: DUF5989 family protein [Terracidiphilus sp.]|nr:DUF5989 family protein [Terracidiphilus sp.]